MARDDLKPSRLAALEISEESSSEHDEHDDFNSEDDLSQENNELEDEISEEDVRSDESHEEVEDAAPPNSVREELSNVSFGALLRAQEAVARKRQREPDVNGSREAKMNALKSRLQQIRTQKSSENGPTSELNSRKRRKVEHAVAFHQPQSKSGIADFGMEDDGSDSDSAPSEEGAGSQSRTSKHAPAAQSSKYQITRRRTVIDAPKRKYRDPRFDALQNNSVPAGNIDKAYSFLKDYQKSEMAELKVAIKKARNESEKEILRRKLGSMENRMRAKEAKEREQAVLRQHRREEREQVEQGKKPYFLKRKDVKERALVEKFKGMKEKDRKKAIEKRKKRDSQKEKKRMPELRRVAG